VKIEQTQPIRLGGGIALTLALISLAGWLAPAERTLGSNLGLILVHGAWVWAGLAAFALAGVAGLVGLALRSAPWHGWSGALGRTGMTMWLTYLPMSLVVQQVNWGGIFWDEPRWRIPFTFGVVGLLLHIGLALLDDPRLTSGANALFGAALGWSLLRADYIMHPQSPISSSGGAIQFSFALLLVLALVLMAQITLLWRLGSRARRDAQ
jgi:hypothetical protein